MDRTARPHTPGCASSAAASRGSSAAPFSIWFSRANDHRKIGLKVLGDTLPAIVERHLEQPVAAQIELHKPLSGNTGRGRREAVRAGRNNAPSREAPRPIGWRNIAPLIGSRASASFSLSRMLASRDEMESETVLGICFGVIFSIYAAAPAKPKRVRVGYRSLRAQSIISATHLSAGLCATHGA